MNMKTVDQNKIRGSKVKHYVVLTAILYVFWILLSGHMDAKFLTYGFLTAVVSAWVTLPLLLIPADDGKEYFWAFDLPYVKYVAYWFWLLWEIVKANIDIAKVVLHPKLPINPQMVTFKKNLQHPLAHVTLANSITLTPGTITVDVDKDVYIIHALTQGAAEGVAPKKGEGPIQVKVAELFNEQHLTTQRGEG